MDEVGGPYADYVECIKINQSRSTTKCASREDSGQHEHPPCLIRVFTVHLKPAMELCYLHGGSEDSGAQADLSLRWANMPLCQTQ